MRALENRIGEVRVAPVASIGNDVRWQIMQSLFSRASHRGKLLPVGCLLRHLGVHDNLRVSVDSNLRTVSRYDVPVALSRITRAPTRIFFCIGCGGLPRLHINVTRP